MTSPTYDSNDLRNDASRVADMVGDVSQNATQQAKKFAQDAADSVREATDYVRDNGSQLAAQVKSYLKENPNHALIGAAVVGFFIGRFMSRD